MSKNPPLQQPPFNGDRFLRNSVETLIRALNVKTIVETGTNRGATALWLASNARTHSIEIDPGRFKIASKLARSKDNLVIHLGTSPDVLSRLIPDLAGPVLFYLDAHWGEYWPILDELREISALPEAIVVIHDFLVPGRNFGFDRYDGKCLDIELIRPAMDEHFKRWTYWYNSQSGGARRGVCFILTGRLCQDPALREE